MNFDKESISEGIFFLGGGGGGGGGEGGLDRVPTKKVKCKIQPANAATHGQIGPGCAGRA